MRHVIRHMPVFVTIVLATASLVAQSRYVVPRDAVGRS